MRNGFENKLVEVSPVGFKIIEAMGMQDFGFILQKREKWERQVVWAVEMDNVIFSKDVSESSGY